MHAGLVRTVVPSPHPGINLLLFSDNPSISLDFRRRRQQQPPAAPFFALVLGHRAGRQIAHTLICRPLCLCEQRTQRPPLKKSCKLKSWIRGAAEQVRRVGCRCADSHEIVPYSSQSLAVGARHLPAIFMSTVPPCASRGSLRSQIAAGIDDLQQYLSVILIHRVAVMAFETQ